MRAWVKWTSEWGPKVRKLIEIEQATGKTPQALLDAPVCYGFERELAIAFNFLTDRRTVGMAVNPIPLSEVVAYLDLVGGTIVPKDMFLELLHVMDAEYLEKVNSDNKPPS